MSGRRIKRDFLSKNGLDRRFIKSYVLALINVRNPETPLLSFAKSHDCISALVNDKSLYIKNKKGEIVHKYESLLYVFKEIILSLEFVQQFIEWSKQVRLKQEYMFGCKLIDQLIEKDQLKEIYTDLNKLGHIITDRNKTKASLILLTSESFLIISFLLDLLSQRFIIVNLEFDGLKIISGDSSNINNSKDLQQRLDNLSITEAKFPLYSSVARRLIGHSVDISFEVYLSSTFDK